MSKSKKKKALGRGLEELLPEIDSAEDLTGPISIEIDLIDANPYQPRKNWDTSNVESLAASIKSQGILQPLVVRRNGRRFQLIAGERRLRAAKKAGLQRIPVVIRDAAEEQMLALALIENIQREDLDPIEKAEGFKMLTEKFSLTQEELARKVGLGRSTVTNLIRLLELPPAVKKLIMNGKLQMGHGRALLALDDEQKIKALAVVTARKEMSVRQLEEKIRTIKGIRTKAKKEKTAKKSVEVKNLENRLRRKLKTKVIITEKTKSSGKIEICYYTLDELEGILKIIDK